MDDYLGSYRNIDLAKETVVSVTKLLSEGGFRQSGYQILTLYLKFCQSQK